MADLNKDHILGVAVGDVDGDGEASNSFVLGDFNRDGKLDIASANMIT